ncbi:uncharacterized protein LOC104903912 [Beta vulgaris subsp. vulgaris]|uniref:uncharacterized protein LOC104903912 n=1 Tax=Beta vulgaris subsp. vulgaris TaxID=3555 RepID=UPI0020371EC6|nr:uncharacterized protein LOC104903912 [Beta vulgaris subsp. vulgaris]XP_010690357.2 uncharacterized protein LOC104903912 [Beta vulgaris subsp. vulgaris]
MAEYTPLHNDVEQPPSLPSTLAPTPMNVAGKSKTSRVASLDVFRGLCVVLMMVVDYGGPIFPSISHAPWNGLHLADFVMPFFLFIAGLSLAIAYKKVGDRMDATKKATLRAMKLFILGVFLQGGYLHGAKSLTYGVDIMRIRWMGILQRISIAYLAAALCEIWLPCQNWRKFRIVRSYFWQWCVTLLLSSIYIGLLYGLYVPDWEVSMSNSGSSVPAVNGTDVYKMKCGSRGSIGPACNSAGMIDRYFLGINHLYMKPSFKNLKVCNKSKDGLVPETSPSWCHAPFDPEGILGSLTAAVTCIIGLQFGHILVQTQDHKERLHRWSMLSSFTFILGLYLVFMGIPLNKSLFTVSYVLVTSACAGFVFCLFYLWVDVWGYRRLMFALEWVGVHALSIFVLLTSNIAIVVFQGFYWRTPENNLIQMVISCFVRQ